MRFIEKLVGALTTAVFVVIALAVPKFGIIFVAIILLTAYAVIKGCIKAEERDNQTIVPLSKEEQEEQMERDFEENSKNIRF